MSKPTAAPARFPYDEHRNMGQVLRAEGSMLYCAHGKPVTALCAKCWRDFNRKG